MAKLNGAQIMARALKDQGVDYMFGIVGFPVTPIARGGAEGRHQVLSAAATSRRPPMPRGAVGYLTGRPGACLMVSGPGVVHGLAGLANAQQNCWPMILIGGASPRPIANGMGAFQEERQVLIATPFCKFAHGIESVPRIPVLCRNGRRAMPIYGRPGACYLDMPDDIIQGEVRARQDRFPVERVRRAAAHASRRRRTSMQALNVLENGASARWSSSARAWPGRAPRTRSAPSSSAPACRSSPPRWARA